MNVTGITKKNYIKFNITFHAALAAIKQNKAFIYINAKQKMRPKYKFCLDF